MEGEVTRIDREVGILRSEDTRMGFEVARMKIAAAWYRSCGLRGLAMG